MSGSTFWKDTVDFLLTGMGSNLFAKTEQLITQIAPLFSIGFGIYFLMIILDAYKNGVDDTLQNIAKRAIGWLIIIACAFNATQYGKIANMAYNMPEALASVFGNEEYNASALDTAWDSIMQFEEVVLAKAAEIAGVSTLPDTLLLLGLALLVLLLAGLFFAIITAFYVVAKLSLAMVIMLGPLFLGFLLFPATRQYGMNWIGQILNYTVTIAFFTILSIFQMDFFNNHWKNALAAPEGGVQLAYLYGIIPMMMTSTIIFVIVAWNVPSIASALTGGAMTGGFSNLSRIVAGAKLPNFKKQETNSIKSK